MLPGLPRVEQLTVHSVRLPEALDGTRVAAVSDLHAGARRGGAAGIARVIERVNTLDPDIIVLLGDIVHRPRHAKECLPLLADLRARIGIWAVLGNHEHAADWRSRFRASRGTLPVASWRELYRESGITLLNNEAQAVGEDEARMWIIGVGDAYSGHHDITAATASVADGEYRLGITHSPDLLDDPGVAGFDLLLAGHSHGGQIRLPILGPLYAPIREPRRRGAGLVCERGTTMYVTRGAGEAFPIRVNCPREISLINLRAGSM